MAWTTPNTVNVGDSYAAATYNTYTRDNMREVWHEVATGTATANVTISATTEATANTIVSASAFTATGSDPVLIEVTGMNVNVGSNAGAEMNIWLYQDGTSIGKMAYFRNNDATDNYALPIHWYRRMTPAAGSRTYTIRASRAGANGTVVAGNGSGTNGMPVTVRVLQRGG